MMMTQSYYGGGGDLDAFHRAATHRTMSNGGAYYERAAPYGTYEPRHGLRQEYAGRAPMYTMIQEPDGLETAGGQARRRVGVACSRCRRRKIKCSGDPGDGTGCLACRNSGANVNDCNFIRVGSEPVPLKAENGSMQIGQYGVENPSSGIDMSTAEYHGPHRQSLPTLHTRSSYPNDYEGHYGASPAEGYTYGSESIPRQDSYASSYGSQDSYRNYSTSGPSSAPATAPLYGQSNTYNFGSLQTPLGGQTSAGRLPSVTAETMSSLNMGSLHSSLPIQTPPERRLPVPYTISYPQPSYSQQIPEIRQLDQAVPTFRPSISTSHSRNAMPWLSDNGSTRNGSIGLQTQPSFSSITPNTQQFPLNTSTATSGPPASADSSFGYQIHQASPYSPDNISPTTTTTPSDSFSATTIPTSTSTMPPPPTTTSLRYRTSDTFLPPLDDSSARRHQEAAQSLYSFSAERAASVAPTDGGRSGSETYANVSRPQPQHAASFDGLRRQSEFDEQRAEGGLGSRISTRSLNGRY